MLMDKGHLYLLTMFILVIGASGCDRSDNGAPDKPATAVKPSRPQVYVVNYPLKYFAERIAGDAAEIVFPVPADVDPVFWQPDALTIASFQRADLIILNGAGYSRWRRHTTLPTSRLLDTSEGFRDQFIEVHNAARHAHGPEGDHQHGGVAFTTWLDPMLAMRQAETIRESLLALLPERREFLNRNFEDLRKDLRGLHDRLEGLTGDRRRSPLLASHPVYQYLARRYDLNLESVLWEPDRAPSERQWSALDQRLMQHPAKWMIWEAPPQPEIKEGLRKRGVGCIVFYPCGNTPPGDRDYLQTMDENINRLQEANEF
ncbi:MAG: metal ABC transporter substrate-binding protein [Planctomycetota bacterium]|jgi:zinc transport system substrate-binding protein